MATYYTDSSSDCELNNENSEDLSYGDLTVFPEFLLSRVRDLRVLHLHHNEITSIPRIIGKFSHLITLDISNNSLSYISTEFIHLKQLRTLISNNNRLKCDTLPKDFGRMQSLEVLQLSGNEFTSVPQQFTELTFLRELHLGGNQISSMPNGIKHLQRYCCLYIIWKISVILFSTGGFMHMI